MAFARHFILCALVLFAGSGWSFAQESPETVLPSPLAGHLLVVYNLKDASSKELAEYYAAMRQIPADHMLGISCSENEEITREEYNKQIRNPINDYLISKKWISRIPGKITLGGHEYKVQQPLDNQIWAIVLMRGMPLKIAEDATYAYPEGIKTEFRTTKASVDSELTLLPYEGIPLEGFVMNVFYSANGGRVFNQTYANYLIMVTRLDAPTAQQVKNMIRDSVETEKLRLTGRAVLDARGIRDEKNAYILGDDWIRKTKSLLAGEGFEVTCDEAPEVIPESAPYNDVGFYAGWYETTAKGFIMRPDFRFRTGAVAYHIHSFSASTLRSETQHWVGPLIAKGASATMGAVYEPYLKVTPDVSVFTKSLLGGLTFAEAAYQSQIGLSWMMTFVGDPLYRPFPRTVETSVELARNGKMNELDFLLLQNARKMSANGQNSEARELLEQGTTEIPTSVMWEGCAELSSVLNLSDDAQIEALKKAQKLAMNPIDKIRIGLKIAEQYRRVKNIAKVMEIYDQLILEFPKEAVLCNVQGIAVAYATEAGWNRFSDRLKPQLSPVTNPKLESR